MNRVLPVFGLVAAMACAKPAPPSPTPPPPDVMALSDSLLDVDALWNFQDPAASRSAFYALHKQQAAALEAGTLAPEDVLRLRAAMLEAETQVARTHSLEGDAATAMLRLDEVSARRDEVVLPPDLRAKVQVREMLERGRALRTKKEVGAARALFVQAWELARQHPPALDGLAVDAAHMVGICDMGSDGELEWGHKALELAESSESAAARKWRASLLNNLGWAAFDRGQHAQALELMERQIVLRQEAGKEPALRIALWSRGRVLRALGRVDEALAVQEKLLADYGEDARADGFVHEELAECLYAVGRRDEARPWFRSAHELLKESWLADAEPDRLRRLAQLGGVE